MKYKLWTKKHQQALILLRDAYMNGKPLADCPLCKTAILKRYFDSSKHACRRCSWMVMYGNSEYIESGDPCQIFFHKWATGNAVSLNCGIDYARYTLDKDWVAARIPMLNDWIKKWEEANGIQS